MDISQLRSRVMAYFPCSPDKTGTPLITGSMVSRASLAEHPHDGLGVAVDDG